MVERLCGRENRSRFPRRGIIFSRLPLPSHSYLSVRIGKERKSTYAAAESQPPQKRRVTARVEFQPDEERGVGSLIKEFRQQHGLTQQGFVDGVNLRKATLVAIEKGVNRKIYRHTVEALIQAVSNHGTQDEPLFQQIIQQLRAQIEKTGEVSRFGSYLTSFRIKHKLSRRAFAAAAGLSENILYKLETGLGQIGLQEIISITDAVTRLRSEVDPIAEAILQERDEEEQKRRQYSEAQVNQMQELSTLVKRLRHEEQITQVNFAKVIGIPLVTLKRIERNSTSFITEKTRETMLASLRTKFGAEDGSASTELVLLLTNIDARSVGTVVATDDKKIEVEKIEESEDDKWLRTFVHADISSMKGILYLRISEFIRQKEFEREAGLSDNTRVSYKLFFHTLNKMIEASPLDPQGKAAQFIRIKETNIDVMSLATLQNCTYADLEKYLRIVKGLSSSKLASELGLYRQLIERREGGNVKKPRDLRHDKFIEILELEGTPLGAVIRYKAENPGEPVPSDMIIGIEDGKYLFQEYIDKLGGVQLSRKDTMLQKRLATITSFGAKLKYLITVHHKMAIVEVARRVGKAKSNTYTYTRGEVVPEDYTVAILLYALGYDIHHPITWDFIEQADKERRAKQSKEKN